MILSRHDSVVPGRGSAPFPPSLFQTQRHARPQWNRGTREIREKRTNREAPKPLSPPTTCPPRPIGWGEGRGEGPAAVHSEALYAHTERPLLRATDGESWADALNYLRRSTFSRSSLPVTALGQLRPTHPPHARPATSPAPPAPLPSLGRGAGESLDGSAGSSRRP